MIGKTISHYKILEEIGSGGMGIVYKAEDINLERHVALKFLPPELTRDNEARERFIHEAKSASALDHPNVCTIYEIGKTEPAPGEPGDNQMFIAMGYYEGETLKDKIARGPLKIDEALDIAIQIATGLEKAHKKSIIHRDIKPANILITNDNLVKILDFGLAKLSGQTKLTKDGSTLGTVAYMSPEQTTGDETDSRSDIWSLGVVLFEMLTGLLPFKGDYEQAMQYCIVNEEPEQLANYDSEISEGFQNIVDKSLSKELETRYQNTDELLIDLEGLSQDIIPSQILRPLKQKVYKNKFVFGGISVFFLFTVLFVSAKYYFMEKTEFNLPTLKDEPSIAIMNFEYLSSDSTLNWLSKSIPTWLTRIFYQVPNLIVKESFSEDFDSAINSAKKQKIKTLLKGAISKVGQEYLVDFQLYDVNNENIIYADQVKESNPDEFQRLTDKLASHIINKLVYNFPDDGLLKLEDFTTNSMDAWRYYIKGIESSQKYQMSRAKDLLFQSIRCDSTFAIAYLELARAHMGSRSQWDEAYEWMEKARYYSKNSSEHERLSILAFSSLYLDDPTTSNAYITKLVQKYPTDFWGIAILATKFMGQKNWKEVIKLSQKWARLTKTLQPFQLIIEGFRMLGENDSAWFYINKISQQYPDAAKNQRIIQYLMEEKFDQAIYEARSVRHHNFRGIGHLFKNQLDSTEYYFNNVQKTSIIPWLSIVHSYQGNYDKTINFLENRSSPKNPKVKLFADYYKLIFYDQINRKEKAKEIWTNLMNDNLYKSTFLFDYKQDHPTYIADSLLSIAIPTAYYEGNCLESLKICDQVEQILQKYNLSLERSLMHLFWRAQSLYKLNRIAEALKDYQFLAAEEEYKSFFHYRVAECLHKMNKNEDAKAALAKVRKIDTSMILQSTTKQYKHMNTIYFTFAYSRQFYLLGKVNEGLDEKQEAINAYQKFLNIWKNADENLPEKIDAQKRLANLLNQG